MNLKNIKVEALTFDERLDPQVFLDWTSDMDHYFNWYDMSDKRRIWFAKMKLIGHARQYWTNVVKVMKLRNYEPIQTWDEMKMKFQDKYLPMSYKQCLLDQWQRLTQGNWPMSKYIKKFDQFLVRYSENEYDAVVISRFHSGLKEDLRRELLVRDVSTLEQVIQLVQDLDQLQFSSFPRRTSYRDNANKTTTVKSQPNLSLVLSLVAPLQDVKTKAKK